MSDVCIYKIVRKKFNYFFNTEGTNEMSGQDIVILGTPSIPSLNTMLKVSMTVLPETKSLPEWNGCFAQ